MNAEQFRAEREKLNAISALRESWNLIDRALNNARPELALDLLAEAEKIAEALGEGFIVTYWPVCRGCNGTAEVEDPTNAQGKRKVCYITEGDVAAGKLCVGNQYGRMHPVQLREHVEALIAKRLPAQPTLPGTGEPDQPPPGALGAGETTDAEVQRRAAVLAFMDEVEQCEACKSAKAAAGVLCPKHAAAQAAVEGLPR